MNKEINEISKKNQPVKDIKYCRTCYDHLAGFVGVKITEALEKKGYIKKSEKVYIISKKGWNWFAEFDIYEEDFANSRRPLTRQCIDCTERRPHLAGHLGAIFLEKMLQKNWFKRVPSSREVVVTAKGHQELFDLLGVTL